MKKFIKLFTCLILLFTFFLTPFSTITSNAEYVDNVYSKYGTSSGGNNNYYFAYRYDAPTQQFRLCCGAKRAVYALGSGGRPGNYHEYYIGDPNSAPECRNATVVQTLADAHNYFYNDCYLKIGNDSTDINSSYANLINGLTISSNRVYQGRNYMLAMHHSGTQSQWVQKSETRNIKVSELTDTRNVLTKLVVKDEYSYITNNSSSSGFSLNNGSSTIINNKINNAGSLSAEALYNKYGEISSNIPSNYYQSAYKLKRTINGDYYIIKQTAHYNQPQIRTWWENGDGNKYDAMNGNVFTPNWINNGNRTFENYTYSKSEKKTFNKNGSGEITLQYPAYNEEVPINLSTQATTTNLNGSVSIDTGVNNNNLSITNLNNAGHFKLSLNEYLGLKDSKLKSGSDGLFGGVTLYYAFNHKENGVNATSITYDNKEYVGEWGSITENTPANRNFDFYVKSIKSKNYNLGDNNKPYFYDSFKLKKNNKVGMTANGSISNNNSASVTINKNQNFDAFTTKQFTQKILQGIIEVTSVAGSN